MQELEYSFSDSSSSIRGSNGSLNLLSDSENENATQIKIKNTGMDIKLINNGVTDSGNSLKSLSVFAADADLMKHPFKTVVNGSLTYTSDDDDDNISVPRGKNVYMTSLSLLNTFLEYFIRQRLISGD